MIAHIFCIVRILWKIKSICFLSFYIFIIYIFRSTDTIQFHNSKELPILLYNMYDKSVIVYFFVLYCRNVNAINIQICNETKIILLTNLPDLLSWKWKFKGGRINELKPSKNQLIHKSRIKENNIDIWLRLQKKNEKRSSCSISKLFRITCFVLILILTNKQIGATDIIIKTN